jgi:hypothetical protein
MSREEEDQQRRGAREIVDGSSGEVSAISDPKDHAGVKITGRANLKAQRSTSSTMAAKTAERKAVGSTSKAGCTTIQHTQSRTTTHIPLSNDRRIAEILCDFGDNVKRGGRKAAILFYNS